VKIVWDEVKRQSNLDKNGLDFADLTEDFFLSSVIVPAKKGRSMAIGALSGGLHSAWPGRPLGDQYAAGERRGKEGRKMTVSKPTVRKTLAQFTPGRGYTQQDWDEVSDSPEATDEELAQAKPFADVFPDLAESIRRGRGPQKAPTKKLVSLRLSPDVLDRFKAGGPGWQSRIDEVLRKAVGLK
jgi:uncharacterized protein (DUF4415 family)